MMMKKRLWGECEGKQIYLFELDDGCGMRARVSNYGGVLQALWVRDAGGRAMDVVLGYDTLEEYRNDTTLFGAMIGPIADRLDGGHCVLGGHEVQLPLNAGPDSMHSGPCGFHNCVWEWEALADGICFYHRFAPGEIGFPGNMDVYLRYRLCAPNVLRLEYAAECDCETALSFTNHSYFNLDGGANHCRGQRLTVYADRYAETERDSDPICTGRALPVEGTPFDFRGGKALEDALCKTDFSEIRTGGGVDHYFLVGGADMRTHARLESAESGLCLECASDAPGILIYTGNGLEAEPGKGGAIYRKNWAVCLETGRFPNAVNFPELREQVLLRPGERYESATEFRFSSDAGRCVKGRTGRKHVG